MSLQRRLGALRCFCYLLPISVASTRMPLAEDVIGLSPLPIAEEIRIDKLDAAIGD